MFLDSAQIRKNVVSRAKDLGFTPASEKASLAVVDMKMTNVRNVDQSIPTENDMICARGVKFQTVYDGVSYNFVCNDSISTC